jgi:hypothetical protein
MKGVEVEVEANRPDGESDLRTGPLERLAIRGRKEDFGDFGSFSTVYRVLSYFGKPSKRMGWIL